MKAKRRMRKKPTPAAWAEEFKPAWNAVRVCSKVGVANNMQG